jgi:hypothetical protein
MVEITFRPEDPEEEEFSETALDAAACVLYLHSRVDLYSFPQEKRFLQWVQQAQDREQIPEEHWDWARFMVDAMLSTGPAPRMVCLKCGRTIEPAELGRDEWDGVDSQDRWAGGAGHRILCPEGHPLLMVWTRIY